MRSNSLKTLLAVAVVVFGLVAVVLLSNFLENSRPAIPESYEDEDLSLKGDKLKGFVFGAEGLVADWYWMRSLQYIGTKLVNNKENLNLDDLRKLNPRLLYPLLDNATTLDPRFISAYSYGAMVLPAIDQDQAIALIEKGISNNPEQWRLYQHLGYIYWRSKDFTKAAESYEKGSKIEGAPQFMRSMAAKMTSDGGERETAREIYTQLFNEAQDSQSRENAQLRLMEIDSLDERDILDKALKRFSETSGRCARSWSELFPLLKATSLPGNRDFRLDQQNRILDPSDAPYLLNSDKCTTELDPEKTRIPISQ
ncbi:MAG: hypothetical protein R2681_06245 [Pyrinomonadaceae bacterium]